MAHNSLIQVRIDDNLKNDADKLFNDLGLDMPSAIRLFLKQSVIHNCIPFEISFSTPNSETISAFKEGDKLLKNPNTRRFSTVEELFKELND